MTVRAIKLTGILFLLLLGFAACTRIALAYYTASSTAVNTAGIAENTCEILESFDPPDSLALENLFEKAVSVQNTGSTDAFIRVRLLFSDLAAADASMLTAAPSAEEAGWYAASDSAGEKSFRAHPPAGWVWVADADLPDPEAPGSSQADPSGGTAAPGAGSAGGEQTPAATGYYYCTQPVGPGESTPCLIRFVKTVYEKEEDILPFDLIVYAESVQTRDRSGLLFSGETAWRQAWQEFLSRR